MATVNAGVLLSLKDHFSQGIKNAGNSVQSFATGAAGALQKVDQAFSGIGTAMGALGVTLSVGAATRDIIQLDDKMSALGVQANISAEKVNELKTRIYDAATSPDIKLNTTELTSGLDSIIERTGDMKFAEENLQLMAQAIRATGAAGSDIGGLFAEFQKMGLGADDARIALDTLTIQGKEGAFTLENLAGLGPRTIAAYTASGRSGAAALIEMGAALQVIRRGTGSSEQAATAFEAVMRSLTNPDKQAKLRQLGVAIRDQEGNFRPVTDIMKEVVELSEGSTELLGTIFDSEAMRAFNSSIAEFLKTGAVTSLHDFNEMLGDGSTIQADAAVRAKTLKANITNLQTSFMKFADSKLTMPLEKLTGLLNKLSEDPEAFKRIFTGIAVGLGAIAAVKIGAGVVSFLSNLKSLKSGKIDIGTGSASSNGMPVFVTNWGGKAGSSSVPSNAAVAQQKTPNGRPAGTPLGKPKVSYGKVAGAGAALAALEAVPSMFMELSAVNADDALSKKEKGRARGGAVGAAVGKIGGTAAGAVAGAAIGSVIPVVGTAVGALVGGAIGYFGGKAGRAIGEKIGEAVTIDDVKIPAEITQEMKSVQSVPPMNPTAELTGAAQMDIRLSIDEYRTQAIARMSKNSTPVQFNTGSVHTARENGH